MNFALRIVGTVTLTVVSSVITAVILTKLSQHMAGMAAKEQEKPRE